MQKRCLVTAIVAALAAESLMAAPASFQDARSFAMGGTGVASARSSAASFFNPALLSIRQQDEQDDFNFVLPSVNGRFADDEEVVDQIDDIQDVVDVLDASINNFRNNPSQTNAARVVADAEDLQQRLNALSGDGLRADAALGTAVNVPSERFSMGVFADATVRGMVTGTFRDNQLIDDVQAAAANLDPVALDNALPNGNIEDSLESTGRVVAAGQVEVGVSLATQFDVGRDRLALGVSPKVVRLQSFELVERISTFDEEDFDNNDEDETKFNFDLGAAYQFGQADQWVVGLSARNVIPMDIETVEGTEIDFDPQVRAGVSHSSEWHTISLDLDLTKNDAIAFDDERRWLSLGGEFDVLDTLQLRAGIRQNLADGDDVADGIEEDTQFTAGVGLSPFGVRVEASGMVAEGEFGAGVELGFGF